VIAAKRASFVRFGPRGGAGGTALWTGVGAGTLGGAEDGDDDAKEGTDLAIGISFAMFCFVVLLGQTGLMWYE
jgi:hypothetical protein